MTTLEGAALLVKLEQEVVPEWAVTVVGYVNTEGQRAYKYIAVGEVSLDPVVYALESVKHDFLHRE